MKVILTGASGFIGSHLTRFFHRQGYTVVPLSRSLKKDMVYWDPFTKKIDPTKLESADVVIHLAGESILGRWSKAKIERIRQSRLVSTGFLSETLLKLKKPPSIYIGASAIGYYGNRPSELLTEKSVRGQGVLAELCEKWEQKTTPLFERGVRVAQARFGVVIGEGGALQKLKAPFSLGLGGVLGTGTQVMSWITIDDVARGLYHIIETPTLSGPINFVTPFPITNRDMTTLIGKRLGRPTFCKVPATLLRVFLGAGADILLSSAYVTPERLLESGFEFRFPDFESALKKYLPVDR